MKKFWSKFISVILLAATLFGLAGCSGCTPIGEENRKKLAAIPKEGNYTFLQSGGGVITKGDEYTVIESEVHKAIKKEGRKIYNEDSCAFNYRLSEDGDFMWFLAEYSHKSDKNDYQHGKYKFAIGSTPLPNLDIKIEYYLPTQTYNGFGLVGMLGDYFICRGEADITAYHLTTFESKTITIQDKEYFSLSENYALTLRRQVGGKQMYRIYDETLTEYTISFNYRQSWYLRMKEDYAFYYDAYSDKCEGVNYKTGEFLDEEQASTLYASYFPAQIEEEYVYSITYKGKTYGWESETYYADTLIKDEDGNDIIKEMPYDKLIIEDLETGEQFQLAPTDMSGGCALVMQQILDIYGNKLHWKQVLVENGEVFFVMVNDESFFGIATSQTSPRIVFKYDEEKSDLVYVGYAMYTYSEIEHIYKGE